VSIKTGGFAKTNRINNPETYRQVFNSSCRSSDKKFLVLARKNSLKQARLGLAVSKKNVNSAVKRNQIKRAIRESFRYHKDILKGLDVVVVAHKKQTIVSNKIIIKSISTHWKIISQCRKF
jgi:ribonuclease P protein component